MTQATPEPLKNDPSREAVDSIRGYSYQMLSSILAWVMLSQDQVLYLEGAEDLDLIDPNTATTLQIKETAKSGNITLNTDHVLNSIGNFWRHKERNSGRSIQFRYLTTSNVALERGDPFGARSKGLEVWERLKTSPDSGQRSAQLRILKGLLQSAQSIPQSLKDFLTSSNDQDIVETLVAPVSWVTNAPTSAELLKQIGDALVHHGERLRIDSKSSEGVIGALHVRLWQTATNPTERALTRADFLRIFDEHTRVSVSSASFNALFAAATGSTLQSPISATTIDLAQTLATPPPLPSRYYRFPELHDSIANSLTNHVAVLYGSTGTGKTTAAASYCANSKREWLWIDLRGSGPDEIRKRLLYSIAALRHLSEAPSIVLDDIDTAADSRIYEGELKRLSAALREKQAALIVTTAHELSPRVALALEFDSNNVTRMPAFSPDDISKFLLQRGCRTEQAARLATAIYFATQGHPQLVHVRVASFEVANFAPPVATELFQPPRDVTDVQAEARRLVAELEQNSRELIYRLSLMTCLLDRSRLMSVASMHPSITEPGNAIDRIVGPWLEITRPGVYRISPLVKTSGEAANGPEWKYRTHSSIAEVFLERPTLSPTDVSEVLAHSIAGRDLSSVAKLAMGLLNASNEVWTAIAESAWWFVHAGTDENASLPPAAKPVLFLTRLLQYRIAAGSNDIKSALRVAARFDLDLPGGNNDLSEELSRFLFLSEMLLLRSSLHLPIAEVLARADSYLNLADTLAEILSSAGSDDPEIKRRMMGPSGRPDVAVFLGWTLAARCTSREILTEIVDKISLIEIGSAQRVLWGIGKDETISNGLLGAIWTAEYRKNIPDWPGLERLFQSVYALAQRLQVEGLARAAATAIVGIYDECLNDAQQSLDLALKFSTELGEFSSLQHGRAVALTHLGRDVEAIRIWQIALPNWTTDEEDIAPVNAHRDAARAASRRLDWRQTSDFLLEGSFRAAALSRTVHRAAFLVDAGFAAWKANDNVLALKSFSEAIPLIDGPTNSSDTHLLYSVRKRAGHTLMWVEARARGAQPPPQFAEPPGACCSNLAIIDESTAPPTPMDFIVLYLVSLESIFSSQTTLWEQYYGRLKGSSYPVVRSNYAALSLRKCIESTQLGALLSIGVDQVNALRLVKAAMDQGMEVWRPFEATASPLSEPEQFEFLRSCLILGTYALAARGRISEIPIDRWRRDADHLGIKMHLSDLLATAEAVFVNGSSAWETFRSPPSRQWSCQNVAALALAMDDGINAANMLRAHGMLAWHLRGLPPSLRSLVADDFAAIVTRGWTRLSEQPFLLRNPRETVPSLQAALKVTDTGLHKAKRVLVAALETATLPSGERTRSAILGLSEE